MEASSDPGLSKIKVPGAKKVRVMKVTKQSNGQLLCEICSGVFEDVNGAVKHMPYCEQESVTQWVGNITKKIDFYILPINLDVMYRVSHQYHNSFNFNFLILHQCYCKTKTFSEKLRYKPWKGHLDLDFFKKLDYFLGLAKNETRRDFFFWLHASTPWLMKWVTILSGVLLSFLFSF